MSLDFVTELPKKHEVFVGRFNIAILKISLFIIYLPKSNHHNTNNKIRTFFLNTLWGMRIIDKDNK